MKDKHLYIINNFENLSQTFGYLNIKTYFKDGDVLDKPIVLLYLSPSFEDLKEVKIEILKNNIDLTNAYGVVDIGIKYKDNLEKIKEFQKLNKLELSWLEKYQLALLINSESNHSSIEFELKKLFEFQKLIKEKY